jgi:hypothetical protein
MPYGEGYTDDELAEQQAAYAATDDEATYEVITAGARFTVSGINSAKVVAGADGIYRKIDEHRDREQRQCQGCGELVDRLTGDGLCRECDTIWSPDRTQ